MQATTSSPDTGAAAVDLRVTSRHDDDDVTSGRPLDLTLSGGVVAEAEAEVKLSGTTPRRDATTPPNTPTSPVTAFKKTMLKRYSA